MKPSIIQRIVKLFIGIIIISLAFGCSKKDDDLFIPPKASAEEIIKLQAEITPTYSGKRVYTGDSVAYESTVSGGYEPYTYSWDFDGDGIADSGMDDPVDIIYDTAGEYTVSLHVVDTEGNEIECSQKINVLEDLVPSVTINSPSQNITIDPGSLVVFSVTVTGGNAPMTYLWDFGGGADNIQTKDTSFVIFNDPGIFSVSFSATDDSGDVVSENRIIAVRQFIHDIDTNPQAYIDSPVNNSGSGVTIYVGDSLDYQGSVVNGNQPFKYQWYFPGGNPSSSTVEDPGIVTYNTSASYITSFIVRDKDNDVSNRVRLSVTVLPRMITLPDLTGMNIYDAIELLEESYLNVGTVYCEHNDSASMHDVISQQPGVGSYLISGSKVNLTISLGPADDSAYLYNKGTIINMYSNNFGIWLAENDFPIEVGTLITGYIEQVLDEPDPVYITAWNDCLFASVPSIVVENIDLLEEKYSVPFTASGAISGSGTMTYTRILIQSGTYAGYWFSVGTYDVQGYTGSIYGYGESSTSEWYGITEGDINGLYLHNGTRGALYITSMSGIQTSGTEMFTWDVPTNIYSVSYEDMELLIQNGIAWSGLASGYTAGTFEYSVSRMYIPFYRAGRYIGTSDSYDQLDSYFSLVQTTDPLDAKIMLPSENIMIVQGETVEFRAYISGNSWPYTITWDFDGDAVADSEGIINGEWIYQIPSADPYIVTLSVTDSEGNTVTDTVEVTVEEANTIPEVAIIAPSDNIIIFQGSTVDFEASVTGGNEPVTYEWDFNGDGITDSTGSLSGSYTFDIIDDFNVTFTATDSDDDQGSGTVSISVRPIQVTPDLAGMTFQNAVSAIGSNSLTVGSCYVEYNPDVSEGQIISQDPQSGTEVFPGTEVSLIVSLGEADSDSSWTQIGLTTGSFPYYIPPVNTPVSIIDTQHQDPFTDNDVCNSTSEYLPSLVEGDNHAVWSGVFSSAPPIQWIDPVTNADVILRQTTGLTGTVTDTSGLIGGIITFSDTTYMIQSGPYSGHLCSSIDWVIGDYTGTMYAVGDSSSGDLLGETYPGEFWGRVNGDIRGMYRTISENNAEIYITSIDGEQASGTLSIAWNDSGYTENTTSYINIPVYIQEGVSWLGQGSGCVTGNLVHSGTSIYLPTFNVGQYIGTWFYYESNPNYYDQSGYIRTYIRKSN